MRDNQLNKGWPRFRQLELTAGAIGHDDSFDGIFFDKTDLVSGCHHIYKLEPLADTAPNRFIELLHEIL